MRDSEFERLVPDAERGGAINDRSTLTSTELVWRAAFTRLRDLGFILRDRYSPDWVPSWVKEGFDDAWLEERDFLWGAYDDGIAIEHATTLDATRASDGLVCAIQMKPPEAESLPILRFLSRPEIISDPRNHACPVLAEMPLDEWTPARVVVYPLARDWRLPPMRLVADALQFCDQMLEGLTFLHEHNIAHRDIAARNIMMDPSALFPQGVNPLATFTRIPVPERKPKYDRVDVYSQMKYWLIDFGLSTMFASKAERRFVIWEGGPRDMPECWEVDAQGEKQPNRPYDAFKADMYSLGKLFQRYFASSIPELRPLISAMTSPSPDARPECATALRAFRTLAHELPRRRLLRGIPNAVQLDWQPWSGADAMSQAMFNWVDYWRCAAKFWWRAPPLPVGGAPDIRR
ncbi:unnamed protein product [Peniophora sp. CBMAI 1063]|nr:unnamed protein product [Peniophora sp. CBMAI 1063]